MIEKLSRGAAVGVALLAVIPYLNGLTGDFTYDDKLIIRDNARIASPSVAGQIFTTHYFGGPLSSGQTYRPLVLLSYAVQRWVHGNRPFFFHVVNVLLHALTTVLLGAWLIELGFPRGPSLASAALFAVVTIHVEAVTGLVGRAEVLAALLVLAAARLWLRATEGESLSWRPYVLCLAAFQAGVFVKENAVVVPGVVFLGELFRGPGLDLRRRLADLVERRGRAFLGLFGPVVVLFAARRAILHGYLMSNEAGIFDLENPLVPLRPAIRAVNGIALLFRYAAKTYVPTGLAADASAYALPLASRLGEPRALLAIGGLLAAAAAAILLLKVKPLAAFGIALFFGTVLPTSNVFFPIGTIYADRLVYLPSAGLCCLLAGVFEEVRYSVPRRSLQWRAGLLAAALLLYTGTTLARNRVWRSDSVLYADMVAKMPGSAKAHYNVAFEAQGREPRLAMVHLKLATRIFPRYYDSWALLGKLLWDQKRMPDAVAAYKRAVEIFPHYENGRWGLARTLEDSGRLEEASRAYIAGISEFPDSYPLAYHWARFLSERERFVDSEREWRRAVAASGGAAVAQLGRARALDRLGRREEAWETARRALLADRSFTDARLFLAESYEAAGKTLGAAGELTRAFRSAPGNRNVACAILELSARRPELRSRLAPAVPGVRARFGGPRGDPGVREALSKTSG